MSERKKERGGQRNGVSRRIQRDMSPEKRGKLEKNKIIILSGSELKARKKRKENSTIKLKKIKIRENYERD